MSIANDELTPQEAAALAEIEFDLTSPHTLEEIAAHLGMSRRTVSRIEDRALAKLRELLSDDWRGGLREAATLQGPGVWGIFPSDGRSDNTHNE